MRLSTGKFHPIKKTQKSSLVVLCSGYGQQGTQREIQMFQNSNSEMNPITRFQHFFTHYSTFDIKKLRSCISISISKDDSK